MHWPFIGDAGRSSAWIIAQPRTNNVSAAKQRRACKRRDLVLMKNDDDCLCWEATLGALISHAVYVNGWELRARSRFLFGTYINKHIYQGSDAHGVSCAAWWERAQVGHYGKCWLTRYTCLFGANGLRTWKKVSHWWQIARSTHRRFE